MTTGATLFHSDTDSVSQPNGLMCVTMRDNQPCASRPQDDDYPDLIRMYLKQALFT